LDGTKDFIKKNGEFTVNIALIENNTPVMGIIYVPVSNVLYFSLKDLGSYYIKGVKNIDNKLDSLLKSSVKLPIVDTIDKIFRFTSNYSNADEFYCCRRNCRQTIG
jgi:3'(2'), 5'-bisphosphate nucleotidase